MSKRLKIPGQKCALNFYPGRFGTLFFSFEDGVLTIRACQGSRKNKKLGLKKNCLSNTDFSPFLCLLENLPSFQIGKRIDDLVKNKKIDLLDHFQIHPEIAIGLYLEGTISKHHIEEAKILEAYTDGNCQEMTIIVLERVRIPHNKKNTLFSFAIVLPEENSDTENIIGIDVDGKIIN